MARLSGSPSRLRSLRSESLTILFVALGCSNDAVCQHSPKSNLSVDLAVASAQPLGRPFSWLAATMGSDLLAKIASSPSLLRREQTVKLAQWLVLEAVSQLALKRPLSVAALDRSAHSKN